MNLDFTPEDAVTFVITSCGRFDLLEKTLSSFANCNTYPIARYILTEDSGDAQVHEVVRKTGLPIEVIFNYPPLGQVASIDLAYARVETPYVFHCEDDWRFFRSGFIEESLAVLKAEPHASMVGLRRPGQLVYHDRVFACDARCTGKIPYRLAPAYCSRFWFGYSFNPGLRRIADARRIGSFEALGNEIDASIWFKAKGMTMATLDVPACETTGSERRLGWPRPEIRHWGRRTKVSAHYMWACIRHLPRRLALIRREKRLQREKELPNAQ